MNRRLRFTLVTAAIAMIALGTSNAASAAPPADDKTFKKQARACIAEIGKHADYSGASRVKHRVTRVSEMNDTQTILEIETSIFSGRRDKVVRRYSTSCQIGGLANVVNLEVDELDA